MSEQDDNHRRGVLALATILAMQEGQPVRFDDAGNVIPDSLDAVSLERAEIIASMTGDGLSEEDKADVVAVADRIREKLFTE